MHSADRRTAAIAPDAPSNPPPDAPINPPPPPWIATRCALTHRISRAPTATLTLPALAGAGTSAEPAQPLASAPAGRLSLGEVALWLRRCFPAYAARPVAQLCGELRDALEGKGGSVTEMAARGETEANSGAVWARINPSPPVAAAAVQ